MLLVLTTLVICAIALMLMIPALVLFIQVVSAMLPAKESRSVQNREATLAVLIPAHNEELVIVQTIASITPQLTRCARLLVVADNCTDSTASLAREAGAEVIERFDDQLQGKGYALDFGVRHLQSAPPDVLLIIDADCRVAAGSINHLAQACVNTGGPVQSVDLMQSSTPTGLNARLAEFAWLVKNYIRPLGLLRLGLPCPLNGTGMGFPWELVAKAQLASGHIAEDMKLGIDLALMGHPAQFCPGAQVSSHFPLGAEAIRTQRTRWEHGHMSMILEEFPRLFCKALVKGDGKLLGLAFDLVIPPLALLVALQLSILFLAIFWYFLGLSGDPLAIALSGIGLLLCAILLAWGRWGRAVVTFRDLLSIPSYIFKKLPLYLKFWTSRQSSWVRTDRD